MSPFYKYSLLAFACLGLAAGLVACTKRKPSPESQPAPDFKSLQEETATYKMEVKYPVSASGAVNAVLESFAKGQVDEFKKVAGEVSFGAKNELNISYKVQAFSPEITGYKFEVESYTGGAHPNTDIFTKTFNLKTGKELALTEIFKPDSDYLSAVSKAAIAQLKSKMQDPDPKWIERGAGPSAENYSRFILKEKEIVFFFDAYQVAPYAQGPQEVSLPYSDLKDFLQTAFVKN